MSIFSNFFMLPFLDYFFSVLLFFLIMFWVVCVHVCNIHVGASIVFYKHHLLVFYHLPLSKFGLDVLPRYIMNN